MGEAPALFIDVEQLTRNYAVVQQAHSRPVTAVVKGDGYGHGLVAATRAFRSAGARSFAVWTLAEAFELRAHGIRDSEIVVLQGFDYSPTDLREAAREDVAVVAGNASVLSGRAAGLRVHLLVEAGLGRCALTPRAAMSLAGKAVALGLRVDGVAVHFAALPEPGVASVICREMSPLLRSPDALHVGGSDALALDVQLPVRAGRLLYGAVPSISRLAEAFSETVHEARAWIARGRGYAAREATLGYDREPVRRDTPVLEISAGYRHGLPPGRSGWIAATATGTWKIVSTAMNVSWAVPRDDATATRACPGPCDVLLAGRTAWAEVRARDLATAAASATSSVLTAPRHR